MLGILLLFMLMSTTPLSASIPKGFNSADKYEETVKKAKDKKKFLTILVKGSDDKCPNCKRTMSNGMDVLKRYSEFVFVRVKSVWDDKSGLPKEVTDQFGKVNGGATVYFFVFDPSTMKLVTQADRKVLQSDKDKIRAFKTQPSHKK